MWHLAAFLNPECSLLGVSRQCTFSIPLAYLPCGKALCKRSFWIYVVVLKCKNFPRLWLRPLFIVLVEQTRYVHCSQLILASESFHPTRQGTICTASWRSIDLLSISVGHCHRPPLAASRERAWFWTQNFGGADGLQTPKWDKPDSSPLFTLACRVPLWREWSK